MAGNTRGKLKEHFEGVHRNFDWCLHHINQALQLIADKLGESDDVKALGDNKEAIQEFVDKYPLYNGIKSLGTGIQTLDELAQGIYDKL